MKKKLRIILGTTFSVFGVVLFILPGSMFVLLLGLFMLSYDFPKARKMLGICQKSMTHSARKLDRMILNRKLRN